MSSNADFSLGQIRERAGFTQERVADHIGVSVSTVRNWEHSRRLIPPADLDMIMALYGVDRYTRLRALLTIYGSREDQEAFGLTM